MADTIIANVKIWKNDRKTETRIYVRTTDGREGCYYLTGNHWHKKGSYEGQLTEAEWKEARRIAVWDGKWHTVFESQLHGTIFGKPINVSNRSTRCPDCGSYTCGPNCNSNRW